MYISQTKNWLKRVVIGENFCPFAKPDFDKDSIRYVVFESEINLSFSDESLSKVDSDESLNSSVNQALLQLLNECQMLDNDPSISTSLIIYSHAFTSFDSFVDWIGIAEQFLLVNHYEGVYQLAHFHPEYCFEDVDIDDAANFTNRSPYPMLHLLRESEVERALQTVKSPESLPARNIRHARSKGADYFKAILRDG